MKKEKQIWKYGHSNQQIEFSENVFCFCFLFIVILVFCVIIFDFFH